MVPVSWSTLDWMPPCGARGATLSPRTVAADCVGEGIIMEHGRPVRSEQARSIARGIAAPAFSPSTALQAVDWAASVPMACELRLEDPRGSSALRPPRADSRDQENEAVLVGSWFQHRETTRSAHVASFVKLPMMTLKVVGCRRGSGLADTR